MLDDGSAINILPNIVLKRFGISIDELSKSNITIQGFNQGGQRALRKIRVGLSIGDVKSHTLIYVIDAKTSYNLLLGRPWVYKNKVVSSTLHQCIKYVKDGKVVKINADINPFADTKSYFIDVKFYLDSCELGMEKPTLANPTNVVVKEVEVQRAAVKMPKERIEKFSTKLLSFEGEMQMNMDEEHLIFSFIPRERRKDGQTLLEECT